MHKDGFYTGNATENGNEIHRGLDDSSSAGRSVQAAAVGDMASLIDGDMKTRLMYDFIKTLSIGFQHFITLLRHYKNSTGNLPLDQQGFPSIPLPMDILTNEGFANISLPATLKLEPFE
eukprot:jgi/Bigna1/140940/aug1.59_g15648